MSSLGLYRNLSAFDGGGDESAPAETGYVTLDVDDHYFPLPVEHADLASVQIVTDATIAGTFTVEACNLPERKGETGPYDVSNFNETSGNWVQVNTASAGWAQGVGTGWTITTLSLAKTAGVGGAVVNLSDLGTRRLRLKATVTTGGTVRVVAHGKG